MLDPEISDTKSDVEDETHSIISDIAEIHQLESGNFPSSSRNSPDKEPHQGEINKKKTIVFIKKKRNESATPE